MTPFDPRNPFPFQPALSSSYADEQAHAFAADAWLGLSVATIEREMMARGCRSRAPAASGEIQELWLGLAASSLLTPYLEIRRFLEAIGLRAGQIVVDLGAAYGRMGFVVARCFPGARFVGYEFSGERVREGNRVLRRYAQALGADARLEHADLSSPTFAPVEADAYFLYDFGAPKAIEKTLHDLRRLSNRRAFTLVARGMRCRQAIRERHAWLRPLDQAKAAPIGDRSSLFVAAPVERWARAGAARSPP